MLCSVRRPTDVHLILLLFVKDIVFTCHHRHVLRLSRSVSILTFLQC